MKPEPEERMLVEHLRDEVVDAEVRARSSCRRSGAASGSRRSKKCQPAVDARTRPAPRPAPSGSEQRAREKSRCRYGTASTSAPTPSPSRPLRESVASSTSEQERRAAPRAASAAGGRARAAGRSASRIRSGTSSIDPEVVRVAGERVRPVDARAVDRAVDVDLARAAGERLENERVEVVARPARRAAAGSRRRALAAIPPRNQRERPPVEARELPREVGDAGDRKPKWSSHLTIPFPNWSSAWPRLEVEEADQVDEQERRAGRRAAPRPCAAPAGRRGRAGRAA